MRRRRETWSASCWGRGRTDLNRRGRRELSAEGAEKSFDEGADSCCAAVLERRNNEGLSLHPQELISAMGIAAGAFCEGCRSRRQEAADWGVDSKALAFALEG
jgi:hypothetical protein